MLRILLFGATGDLSIKKLYPALFELLDQGRLPGDTQIICLGRRDFDNGQLHDFVAEHVGGTRDVKSWFRFIKQLTYVSLRFDHQEDFLTLAQGIDDKEEDTHIFYLATAPQYFETIVSHLSHTHLLKYGNENHRVVIEKPFGKDLKSAIKINDHLAQYLVEKQIYRMDHYLGKEMIQNIMMLRYSNMLFEASWNKDYIDHVQITVAESVGVFERAGYYDKSGAVRDMIQSHLLQMLALVAMSPDQSQVGPDLVDAKVDVLRALVLEDVTKDVVLGQYQGQGQVLAYRQEKGVRPDSKTETYAAMRLRVDLPRWQGVDFYLRTGKRLRDKVSEIVLVYKTPPVLGSSKCPPNTLTIEIHPKEGMALTFNMKDPLSPDGLVTRRMEFCQSCLVDYDAPESYETLILEAVQGKHDLYTRWDEVKHEWLFVEKILGECVSLGQGLAMYPAGSQGPKEADALLEASGRHWLSLKGADE